MEGWLLHDKAICDFLPFTIQSQLATHLVEAKERLEWLPSEAQVVQTSTEGNGHGSNGTNWSSEAEGVWSSDTELSVGDTGGQEAGVGRVNEVSWGTVEFSEEDQEEAEWGEFGKVGMGSDGTLELFLVSGLGGLWLVAWFAD